MLDQLKGNTLGVDINEDVVRKTYSDLPLIHKARLFSAAARAELFTSPHKHMSENYAISNSYIGGELNHVLIGRINGKGIENRLAPGKSVPVLLELDVPDTVASRARNQDSDLILRSKNEFQIRSVIPAKKDHNGDWTFSGQQALDPQKYFSALRIRFPPSRENAGHNLLGREILTDIYEGYPQGTISHNSVSFLGSYVRKIEIAGTTGHKSHITIPDPTFVPNAEQLTQYGFLSRHHEYNLPHNLTPIEAKAYMDALDVKVAHKIVPPEYRDAKLVEFAQEVRLLNSGLPTNIENNLSPHQAKKLLVGVVNKVSPKDLSYSLSSQAETPRHIHYREQTKTQHLSGDVVYHPSTLREIRTRFNASMDQKLSGNSDPTSAETANKAETKAADKMRPPNSSSTTSAPTRPVNGTGDSKSTQPHAGVHAGKAVATANVSADIAAGHYSSAATNVAVQVGLSESFWKAGAKSAGSLAKIFGQIAKRIPLVGAAVTVGYVAYEVGNNTAEKNYKKAGTALAAGAAEIGGNFIGFDVGDAARQGVVETAKAVGGEKLAPDDSGLVEVGKKVVNTATSKLYP